LDVLFEPESFDFLWIEYLGDKPVGIVLVFRKEMLDSTVFDDIYSNAVYSVHLV